MRRRDLNRCAVLTALALGLVPTLAHAQAIPDYILLNRCVATMDEVRPTRNATWQLGVPIVHIRDAATGQGGWSERHRFQFTAYAYVNGANGYAEFGTGDDICLGPIDELPGTGTIVYEVVAAAPDAASGTFALADSPSGNYTGSRNISATINQSFNFSGATEVRLLFFHHHALLWTANFDLGRIEVSTNGGASWTNVDPDNTPFSANYQNYYGDKHQYKRGGADLSAFAGQSDVRIRLRFTSSSSSPDDGWFVDDVRVLVDGTTVFFDDFESGTGQWTLNSPWDLTLPTYSYNANLGTIDATGLYQVVPITAPASVGEGMGFGAVHASYELSGVTRHAYARIYHTSPQYVASPDFGEEDLCKNTVAIEDVTAPIHERLLLEQNAPNPFNPSTRIRFRLDGASSSTLQIYDQAGRLVRTLLDGDQLTAGEHTVEWDGRNDRGELQSSGIYLYKLEAGGQTVARKMVMVR